MSTPSSPAVLDVLVVGGGPVGQTLALVLARGGLSVGLMDAREPDAAVGPDPRAFLIAAGCWRIFSALGLDAQLRSLAEPVVRLENQAPGGAISFGIDDSGESDALGFMIEARHLDSVLTDATRSHPGIVNLSPRRLLSAAFGDPFAIAETDRGPVRARLLAACDGGRSPLRTLAGLRFEGWDYGMKALSVFVRLAEPHGGLARQRFVRQGPLAVLPLRGDRANLIWSVKAPVADHLLRVSTDAFQAELDDSGEGFAGRFELEMRPVAYPIGAYVAERFHAHRLVVVGDAAHRIPPLAGQGLNLGLKDVADLADVLGEALQLGLDPGSAAQLEPYTSRRRPDAVAMAAAMDGFLRLFAARSPVRAVAGTAMGLAGRAGPLRRFFARSAGASEANAPSVMRPRAD